MNPNLGLHEDRKKILESLKSAENIDRKARSYKQYEILKDRIHDYVVEHLKSQFDADTVRMMPIISSINIAKRMLSQEASIYRDEPVRTFSGIEDPDVEAMKAIYSDGRFDSKMKKANFYFKAFKDQCVVQVILIDGAITLRVLAPHQFDVVPDAANPEKAFAYLVNLKPRAKDPKDQRFTVWSDEWNFIMDGNGLIQSSPQHLKNDLGLMPFVDIAGDKEFSFFVDLGETDGDFTVQYNAALSDLQNICRLQGYAQAVYIGDPKSMPSSIKIGPNVVLKIPINPDQPVQNTDFKFVTPNPDIEGSIKQIEQLLANYLTTRGIDTKSIAGKLDGTQAYSSGIERMLAMIERFEASKDDLSVFTWAEKEIFKIVKAWVEKYSRTQYLKKEYWGGAKLPNAVQSVAYSKPTSIQTDDERNKDLEFRIKHGVADAVTILVETKGMSEEAALEEVKKLAKRKADLKAFLAPEDEGEDEVPAKVPGMPGDEKPKPE